MAIAKPFSRGQNLLLISGAALACQLLLPPLAQAGTCRDPWVTKAVTQVMSRAPSGSGDSGECDYRRYGGGQWSSYDDLLGKVRKTFGQSSAAPLAGQLMPPSTLLGTPKPMLTPGAGIVSNNGSRVIGQNGASVIGPNGASVIGQNGANVIGQNGANAVQR